MRAFIRTLVLLLLAWTVPPAAAAESGDQIKLTPALVERYLAGYPDFVALAKDLSAKFGDRSEVEGDDPVMSLPAYESEKEASERIGAVLRKHAVADLDEWQVLMNSVLVAYQALDPGQPADPEAEKAQARKDIEADKSLSAEERKQALQELDEQFNALTGYVPLAGNVDVVRPFADRIKALIERK